MGPGELSATARVLGDAFLDDPVWGAIGPRIRAHRRIANRISFAGILTGSRRQDARIRVSRSGPEITGASLAFEPGGWPIPEGSAIWELGWLLIAGPLPAWRGIRDDRAMRASHVTHPHMYLWFLGVAPQHQGRGVGRALLADLHAESDKAGVPTYLETATAENVAFYRRDGYERLGEIKMPSGPRMWRMERPAYAT
jgi:GNAT superfamily N-acetyltransferase